MSPGSHVADVMSALILEAKAINAPYTILTDERVVVLFAMTTSRSYKQPRMAVLDTTKHPLRLVLGEVIYTESCRMHLNAMDGDRELPQRTEAKKGWFIVPYQPVDGTPATISKTKRKVSDWDPATLRDLPGQLDMFLAWKRHCRDQSLQNRPSSYTLEALVDGLGKCHKLQRSRFIKNSSTSMTSNIDRALALFETWRRPRSNKLDDILRGKPTFRFKIEEVVSDGGARFSHIVRGKVDGCEETVLLKLYDEQLFPADDIKRQIEGEQKLDDSEKADKFHLNGQEHDVIAHEEAAYAALEPLQGSILPHCYGFHLVRRF